MKFYFLVFLSVVLLALPVNALPPDALYSNPTQDGNGNIDPENICIMSLNGCDNGDLIYRPGFCNFEVNIPDANEDVYINVIKGQRYGSVLEDDFYLNNDQNFMVWVDRERSPVYITCSSYVEDKNQYELVDHIALGLSDDYTDTNITNTYTNIDKDSVWGKWLFGMLFILIGAMLFFDTFFNRRFSSYI